MPNEFSKSSDNAYWAWSYKHLQLLDRELPVCRESFNAGFYLGAQYATRVTGEMSPHLARFMEFVMWLTDRPEDSTTSSTNRGSSSVENTNAEAAWYADNDTGDTYGEEYSFTPCHLKGHRTELRNDDSVFCLECRSTVAVADG